MIEIVPGLSKRVGQRVGTASARGYGPQIVPSGVVAGPLDLIGHTVAREPTDGFHADDASLHVVGGPTATPTIAATIGGCERYVVKIDRGRLTRNRRTGAVK